MKKSSKLFSAAISLLFIVIFVLSILIQNYIKTTFGGKLLTYGLFFVFFIPILFEMIPQYIAPHIVLINAVILGIPIFLALPLTILGSTIGAFLGFSIGRRYGINLTKQFYTKKQIAKMGNTVNRYGKWFVLIAALSPLPYVPLVFGSLNMTKKNFIYFGLIPRAIGLIFIGLVLF